MEHARHRLAGNPYAIRASGAAIAAIDAKLTEAYRAHVATASGAGSIDPIAAYVQLQAMNDANQDNHRLKLAGLPIARKLKAVDTLTHEAQCELALRADQFAALPGAATPRHSADASCSLPWSLQRQALSPRPLPEGFHWRVANQRLRAQRDWYQQSGNSLATLVYNAALESIDQALRDALRAHELTADVSDPAAAYRKLHDRMNEYPSSDSLRYQQVPISRLLRLIDSQTYENNADLALCDGGFAALSEVPPPDSGPRSACSPRALEYWLGQQEKSAANRERRACRSSDNEAAQAAAAEQAYFCMLRNQHLIGDDPWHVSRSFIRSGTTQAPHLEAAHGRLLEAMANPALPECAVAVDESTQESPPGPHTHLEAATPPTRPKRLPISFRWEAAYSDLHMRHAQHQLAGDTYATRASAEGIASIDTEVAKAYHVHASQISATVPIEPEAVYCALRKLNGTAAEVLPYEGYRYDLSRKLGALDRLTGEISREITLRATECASATRAKTFVGAPGIPSEFYAGSHPPGSTIIPTAVNLPSPFDWIAARRELIGRREQYRQDGNRLAARMSDMAIEAIDDRMRGIYDLQGWTVDVVEAEAAYSELLRIFNECESGALPTKAKQSLGRRLTDLHKLTYYKTVEFARIDRGFATLCMPAAPAGPGPLLNTAVLARWLRKEATRSCENEARALEDDNHWAAQAAWKEHVYFTRLREELDRECDPWTASRKLLKSLAEPGHDHPPPQLVEAHGRLLRAMSDSTMQVEEERSGEDVRPPVSASLPSSQAGLGTARRNRPDDQNHRQSP